MTQNILHGYIISQLKKASNFTPKWAEKATTIDPYPKKWTRKCPLFGVRIMIVAEFLCYIFFERARGVEPLSRVWKTRIIAVIWCPQWVEYPIHLVCPNEEDHTPRSIWCPHPIRVKIIPKSHQKSTPAWQQAVANRLDKNQIPCYNIRIFYIIWPPIGQTAQTDNKTRMGVI